MQRDFKGALSVTYSRLDFKKEMVEVAPALSLRNLQTQPALFLRLQLLSTLTCRSFSKTLFIPELKTECIVKTELFEKR